jgi:hypothetical protein
MLPLAASLAASVPAALAQTDYAAPALKDSGKILVIVKEVLKPGKEGQAHEKTEAQFARAMAASKVDDYYMGMTSLSGPPRALFFSSYSSLAELEAKRKAAPASLGPVLDKINEADGAVLSDVSTTYFVRNDKLSTNVKSAPSGVHYMEITSVLVKPGREAEFEQASKMYLDDMVKGVPSAHWTCYSSYYGHTEGTLYIFLTALKSMAEADAEMASMSDFAKAAGPMDLVKLNDEVTTTALTFETNIFRISPSMSYPNPAMAAADPDFWKPKPMPAAPKKPEAKPAQ